MDKKSDILNEKGEIASAVSNMASRIKNGTMSYFGNQTAKGKIDLLNTATKLKKDFLRWSGQREVPHTIGSIGEYLRTTYNYEIDSSGQPTGETAKAGEEAAAETGDEAEAETEDNIAPNGADLDQQADANAAAQEKSVAAAAEPETAPGAVEQPEAPAPAPGFGNTSKEERLAARGTQGTQGTQAPMDADEKRAAQDAEQQADAADQNPLADMPAQAQPKTKEEIDSSIAQLKAKLYTKKVEPAEAMSSIRDILASARASGGDSKKAAVEFIRRLKNDTRMTEKFPQLGAITDSDLDSFNEHFERVTSAALFIVENDVRDARLIKAVVNYHLNENYGNKKLDKVQMDRVFKLVATHMIKHDLVDFTDPGANQKSKRKPQTRNRFTDKDDDEEGSKKTTFDINKFRALCDEAGIDERDIERINQAAGAANGDINFVLKNMPQDGDMAKKMLSAAMLSMPTK